MKILLSNDDGIHAPGISVLHKAIGGLGELHVVAPDTERSAAGHAITLTDPIKAITVEKNGQLFGTAVGGTPADCIKLALCLLMKDAHPDLVVSGINLGSNTGISVLYSGTVSAASEAVILGVPGIALSLCTYQNPHWDTAEKVAAEIVAKVLKNPLPDGTLLNVNIPNIPYSEVKGMKAARMGRSRFVEKFSVHRDPRGNDYYWLGFPSTATRAATTTTGSTASSTCSTTPPTPTSAWSNPATSPSPPSTSTSPPTTPWNTLQRGT